MTTPELTFYLRSLARFIYFVTDEEDRFLVRLQQTLKDYSKRTWVYNAALGLVPLDGLIADWKQRTHTENSETLNIHNALVQIYKDDPKREQNFYIVTDPERWLVDPHVQRRFLNIAHQLHQDNTVVKIVIFVGNRKVVPEKLAKYVEVVHDKGLTSDEIMGVVEDAARNLHTDVPADTPKLFKGLSSYEIKMAISQSIIATKKDAKNPRRIDPDIISEYRQKQLKKSDLVQYIDTSTFNFDDVGGAGRFKAWAKKTRAVWTEQGQKFGLRPPKGVLLVGVWGCGKSLSVKAMGHAWNLPIVQVEMGKLRSSGVGESEANVYRVTKLIEAAAPCVTGETEVTLADGSTKPIEEIWQDASHDLKVMCWNEKTLRAETTSVEMVTRREAEAFRVSAANGFALNATANHQHYALRGGMPEWVRTDELRTGDMLAVPLARHNGAKDCSRFHPDGMRTYTREDGSSELRRGGGGYRDARVGKLPTEWTPSLGWLLGVIEGDGYLGVRGAIGLVNTSTVLLDKFERMLHDHFGVTAVRRETSNENPNLHGLSDNSVFKTCWDSKASNLLVSEFLNNARESILTAPEQVRAAFLAGWVDADGCIQPDKMILTIKGPKLREEKRRLARQVIQSLGVVPSKFNTVNMEITGSRAVALARALGEHLVLKSAKALIVSSSEHGFDRGMGFACGAVLAEARKQSGLTFADLGVSSSITWGCENGSKLLSERHLKDYIARLGDDAAEDLSRLRDAECRWVSITGIESIGTQPVYDLVCKGENTHSFFANGLVTHNCIVWIDEAEKSLSGGASSGASDAGTTSRTIGILSTWLQETDAKVCLAMTANSLKTLPVEFVNRLDERFFFDLPTEEDRVDILKIHLKKAGQTPDDFDLAGLSEKAAGMVGREMEQAIGAAMIESFDQGKKALDEGVLADELAHKPRIIKTMADEVRETLEWVGYDPEANDGIRAKFASAPDRKTGALKLIGTDE